MTHAHAHVLTNVDLEFQRMDRMFSHGDMRLFGKDTEHIFKELDLIRRKQIDLARDHIALETINDLPQSSGANMEHDYQQSIESFNKKEMALKNLMLKLDDLGDSMNRFRCLFEPTRVHEYGANHPASASLSFDSNTNGSPTASPAQEHPLSP